jgi:hypothetical protein
MKMLLAGMAFTAAAVTAVALTLKSFVAIIEAITYIAGWATDTRDALMDREEDEEE